MRTPVPSNRAIQTILLNKTKPKTTCIPPFSTPTHRSFSATPSPKMTTATATPFKIHLTPDNTGLLSIKQTSEAANTVSDLLQQDLEVPPHPPNPPTQPIKTNP